MPHDGFANAVGSCVVAPHFGSQPPLQSLDTASRGSHCAAFGCFSLVPLHKLSVRRCQPIHMQNTYRVGICCSCIYIFAGGGYLYSHTHHARPIGGVLELLFAFV